MKDDKLKKDLSNNELDDNIYENFSKGIAENNASNAVNSNDTNNKNEPYRYVEKEHNDNYLEEHTVVTKASKVSRIVLVGFYTLFIVVGILVFLMLRADRYEFYLVRDEVKINNGSNYQVELTPKNIRYFDYLNYKYEIADESIATVDEFGTITAVGTGTTTLTISMKPFTSKTMKISSEKIDIQSISLASYKKDKIKKSTSFNLQPNQTITLKAIANEKEDVEVTVNYSSSNPKVATVDEFGNVTTIGAGTAIITGIKNNITGSVVVDVKKPNTGSSGSSSSGSNSSGSSSSGSNSSGSSSSGSNSSESSSSAKITKVDIGTSRITKYINETLSLTPTITPSEAKAKSITWSSSNTKVVTVTQKGVVKTVGQGTAVITVNADGVEDTCTIIVKDSNSQSNQTIPTVSGTQFSVSQVKLSATSLTVAKGSTSKFTITVTGAAGVINISSSNSGIAKVSSSSSDCNEGRCFFDAQEGKSTSIEFTVTGVASGTAYINATLEADDFFKYDLTALSGSGKVGITVK